jgi:hypothetical protein
MASEPVNTHAQTPRGEAIARLNDKLRQHGQGGAIMLTRGVQLLGDYCPLTLMSALARYDRFDMHNDPHGERDFGDLSLFGADMLWKIDYDDQSLTYGSEDPANPAITQRILTVMLACEY